MKAGPHPETQSDMTSGIVVRVGLGKGRNNGGAGHHDKKGQDNKKIMHSKNLLPGWGTRHGLTFVTMN